MYLVSRGFGSLVSAGSGERPSLIPLVGVEWRPSAIRMRGNDKAGLSRQQQRPDYSRGNRTCRTMDLDYDLQRLRKRGNDKVGLSGSSYVWIILEVIGRVEQRTGITTFSDSRK